MTQTETPIITFGNIADVVAGQLREMILSGELQPGQWIRHSEMAGLLGVSIMPVREALRQLQAEGLVDFHPRRGAQVAQISLDSFLELDRISEELERLACTWVGEDFRRIPLDEMARTLEEIEAAEEQHDVSRRLKLVRHFRFIIYRSMDKPHLLNMLANLSDITTPYRRIFSSVAEYAPARVAVYRRIYGACQSQDLPALLEAMRELYTLARRVVLAYFGGRPS